MYDDFIWQKFHSNNTYIFGFLVNPETSKSGDVIIDIAHSKSQKCNFWLLLQTPR